MVRPFLAASEVWQFSFNLFAVYIFLHCGTNTTSHPRQTASYGVRIAYNSRGWVSMAPDACCDRVFTALSG
jgi:hypothetical protein